MGFLTCRLLVLVAAIFVFLHFGDFLFSGLEKSMFYYENDVCLRVWYFSNLVFILSEGVFNNNNAGAAGTGGSRNSKTSHDGIDTQGREFRTPSTGMLRE